MHQPGSGTRQAIERSFLECNMKIRQGMQIPVNLVINRGLEQVSFPLAPLISSWRRAVWLFSRLGIFQSGVNS